MNTKPVILGLVLAGTLLATAQESRADGGRRLNDLHDQVAVRHRRLLVKGRFEVTPLFESSINADYYNVLGGGGKLEYHLSDMWSIGGVVVGSASIKTALYNRVVGTLPSTDPGMNDKTPTQEQFVDHLNQMPVHGAAYISFTPWYGKLAAFASAYVAFDFYFQGGISYAQLTSNCPTNVCTDTHPGVPDPNDPTIGPVLNPKYDPPLNDGTRIGLYLGGGIHVFLNDFLALDLTVRDYAFTDNPSGADFNGDFYVGNNKMLGDDNRFLHHLFFGAGLSVMFPTTVKRTP